MHPENNNNAKRMGTNTHYIYKGIGQNIRSTAKAKGIALHQLAKDLDLLPNNFARLIDNERITLHDVFRLADALNVHPCKLIDNTITTAGETPKYCPYCGHELITDNEHQPASTKAAQRQEKKKEE